MNKFTIKPPFVLGTIVGGAFIFWLGCELETVWLALIGFVPLFIASCYCGHLLYKNIFGKME